MSIESTIERWRNYVANEEAVADETRAGTMALARASAWERAIEELSDEQDLSPSLRIANAIDRIERALGMSGNNTLDETVQAVEDLVRDARELARVAKMRGDQR